MPFVRSWLLLVLLTCSAVARERGSFSALTEPRASVKGGGQVTLMETRLSSGLPPLRSGNHMVNIGFEWTRYAFAFDDAPFEDFQVDSLGLPVRWGFGPKQGLSGSLIFNPSLRTDFDGITTDDLGLSGLALGRYPWRTNLILSFGAVYARSFGRNRLFPAVGATWNPTPDWQVDLVFPRPRVSYQATDSTQIMVGLEPGGDQWNVRLNDVNRDLALEEFRAGVGVEQSLGGRWALIAHGGSVFGRSLKVYDGRDRESKRDLGDTWFARIGLRYR